MRLEFFIKNIFIITIVLGMWFLYTNCPAKRLNQKATAQLQHSPSSQPPIIRLNPDEVQKRIDQNPSPTANIPGKRQIGVAVRKDIDVLEQASKTDLQNGTLYQLQIYSQDAFGLLVEFSNVYLPDGCSITFYNGDQSVNYGRYTKSDMDDRKIFTSRIIPGETASIHVFVPDYTVQKPGLIISRIGHCYKQPKMLDPNFFDSTFEKHLCTHENIEKHPNWLDKARSVVRLYISVINDYGIVNESYGTGVLVSNKRDYDNIGKECEEPDPVDIYMLTACHVIDVSHDFEIDNDDYLNLFNLLQIYFNHHNGGYTPYMSIGAILLDYSLYKNKDRACADGDYFDWALLKLRFGDKVLRDINPSFAGIDFTPRPHRTGPIVNIHHPLQAGKKFNHAPMSFTVGPCRDIYAEWDMGQHTQSGSSGSPFFDAISRRVVGITRYGRSQTSDCSDHAYATSLFKIWGPRMAIYLNNPENPISGDILDGFDTLPIIINDFSTFHGGEHKFATTDKLELGLQARFDNTDVDFRAQSIGYAQPMDPSAPMAGLSLWNNTTAHIQATHWDVPVMTIGDPYSYMSDHSKVKVYVCESEPIENYEMNAMEEVEFQVNSDLQIGKPTDAVSGQAISYQPWAKLTIEAPRIEINQPFATKFILPQQQQEYGGYVRLISYEGASIGNPEMHTIDIHTISHIMLGGLMTQGRNVFFRMYQNGNLEIEAINSLYFKNTTIQFDRLPIIGPKPPVAIRGQTLDAELFEMLVENQNTKIDFYGGVVNGNQVDIFMPPRIHVPYPHHNIKNAHDAVDKSANDSQVASKPETSVIKKIAPKPASYEDSTDFDLYLTAESWNMENVKIKSAKQSKVLIQANTIRISRESEINTNGSALKKDGTVVLRALPLQQTAQFTAELKNQITDRIKTCSIKNDIEPFLAGTKKPSKSKITADEPVILPGTRDLPGHCKPESEDDNPETHQIEFAAYPNPFNPATKIDFYLPTEAQVQITLFNMLGQQITQLVEGQYSAGHHRVWWQAQSHPSGTYFCAIKVIPTDGSEPISKTLKLALVK